VTRIYPSLVCRPSPSRRPALRGSLLHGVSLSALIVAGAAGPAHANPFKSLSAALASHPSAAVTAASNGGGITAANAAGLGVKNLTAAANRFLSLQQALNSTGYTGAAIPDGIGPNGLQQATGVSSSGTNTAAWSGASNTLTQTVVKGVTDVTVTQTSSVAYLTWKNFSIGPKTDLIFNQSAGGTLASNWVAINYVAPSLNPTTILGQISAPGKVYIINANGILFGAGSQVNVGALVASTANIAQSQLTTSANGLVTGFTLYGPQATNTTFAPSFVCQVAAGCGSVEVQAGAEIQTPAPSGSNGGGYVMLLGGTVENDGIISTPRGQTVLAAGSNIFVEPGYSSSNTLATVIGSEVATSNAASTGGSTTGTGTTALGAATNTGIIVADQGDITMVGHLVTQAGILLATTTVDNRGTVHLLTPTNDATSAVVLAPGSVTEVVPEDDGLTALESQRATDIANSAIYNQNRLAAQIGPTLNDFNKLPDEIGESRIEISSGGTVTLQGGAVALAQGGQVAVGGESVLLQSGSTVDVSGTNAVLPAIMNSLNVSSIVPYYLRDSQANRTGGLEFASVYVDERTLVDITGSSDYAGNVYTRGGLLEVSGLLGLVGHGIDEFSAIGGQVTLQAVSNTGSTSAAGTVLIANGATINLTGGTVTYDAGLVPQSYVQAADGAVYNINDAPGNLVYTSVYNGQVVDHKRWNISDTYVNPLLTPSEVYEPAYTIGRDAGTLTVTAGTGIIDGTVDAGVSVSTLQTAAHPTTVSDPFLLAQNVTPLAGALLVGDYDGGAFGLPFSSSITLGAPFGAPFSGGSGGTPPVVTAVPDTLTGTISVGAAALDADGFSRITFSTTGDITVAAPITLANGGAITLSGETIAVLSSITAHGGQITLSNLFPGSTTQDPVSTTPGSITLASGASLDASGQWTNQEVNPDSTTLAGYANAGSVTIIGTGGVDLQAGSVIDVASGGVLSSAGKLTAASGGSVSVSADIVPTFFNTLDQFGAVTYAAAFLGYGSGGAGTLSLSAPAVVLGPDAPNYFDNTLVVNQSLFNSGFADYALNGYLGLTVNAGEQINVTRPVYVLANPLLQTGEAAAGAFSIFLPPVYAPVKGADTITQRGGASLTLAASVDPSNFEGNGGTVSIGAGARISVDPGQSITVEGYEQVTDLGTLTAHGGTITIANTRYEILPNNSDGQTSNFEDGLSVWIGDQALVDVSGDAAVFTDTQGRRYGQAQAGGAIFLGGLGGLSGASAESTYAQVIVQSGAVLNASGAAATVDVSAGFDPGSIVSLHAPVTLAGNGGLIAARSYDGISFEGTLLAAGAGPGAAGGTLAMRLDVQELSDFDNLPLSYIVPQQILISQNYIPVQTQTGLAPGDATDPATIGIGRISQQQLTAGGFDTLNLFAQDQIAFDGAVSLHLGRSVTLESGIIGETTGNVAASVTAPFVNLIGWSSSPNYNGGLDQYGSNGHVQSQTLTTSTLTINADLIDFTNSINFGGEKTLAMGDSTPVLFASTYGFSQANFDSTGDIRFNGDTGGLAALVESSGNITFRAAQLYPTTSTPSVAVITDVVAGLNVDAPSGQNGLLGGTLTVQGLGGAAPAVPYSIGGTLGLFADTVIQDGVVRAPEGQIQLGKLLIAGASPLYTDSVVLGDKSITSVSLDGLTVPYGGTVDGVNYLYDGIAVTAFNPVIQLASVNVSVNSGATIDISGGGTLAGAGFIAGRGGSTNVNVSPLLNTSTGTATANTTDPIFAILPGYGTQYAPQSPADGAYSAPAAGEQITVGAGEVQGLAAGTYTLLPAYYDLLPGAFRVELTGGTVAAGSAIPFGNFTTVAAVTVGFANSDVQRSLPTAALITPQSGVLQLSEFDQETYSTFEVNNAATFDQPRPFLPQDAKTLLIYFNTPVATAADPSPAGGTLTIAPGTLAQTPGADGYGATAELESLSALELTGPGGSVTQLPSGTGTGTQLTIGIDAAMLSALNLPRIVVGGTLAVDNGTPNLIAITGDTPAVAVESGADLVAGDILLTTTNLGGGSISVSAGATLSTLGAPDTAYGLAQGYYFTTDSPASHASAPLLGISNSDLVFTVNVDGASGAAITVAAGAVIEGKGSLNFVAPTGTSVQIGQAQLSAGSVDLQVADINIGSQADLTAFAGLLPAGLTLTDAGLSALANASSELVLTAQQAVNLIGSVTINSTTTDLVINTPAIFGYGVVSNQGTVVTTTTSAAGSATTTGLLNPVTLSTDGGNATITAPNLTWSGLLTTNIISSLETLTTSATPGGRLAGGVTVSATPLGTMTTVDASTNTTTTVVTSSNVVDSLTDATSLTIGATKTLDLGYGPNAQVNDQVQLARLTVGYANVTLQGGTEITANNESSLTVYQDQPVFGTAGTGGNLTLLTPLVTAQSGALLGLTAGGAFSATNSVGGTPLYTPAATGSVSTLGAEIDITAATVDTSTSIALPAGKLSITTQGNIDLQTGTDIDLAGRATKLFDQTVDSNGGTLILQAYAGTPGANDAGSISEDAGASIDVASPGANAGDITAIAAGGTVAFNGSLSGGATGGNAGGSFTVFANSLSSSNGAQTPFDTLNAALNAGGFNAYRGIELATGDIIVDQTITAHQVSLGADAGSIEVLGTINASGATPGTITLSAANTLTLDSTAVLDAHATKTAVDSYGEEIDAANSAQVTLTSSNGSVVLNPGAAINVSYPDASNLQGQIVINAPRISGTSGGLTDVAVSAPGSLSITGAASIDLFAFTTYTPNQTTSTVVNGTVVQDNGAGTAAGNAVTASGTIGLVQINADNAAYMATVQADGATLAIQLAGLVEYAPNGAKPGASFNLLPGVTIASTATGSLTISGDLDFSAFRYTDPAQFGIAVNAAVYGSGEPGAVVFRSANDLVVNGSVSDGFDLPPDLQNSVKGSISEYPGQTNGWEFLTSSVGGFETTNEDVLLPQGSIAVYTPKTGPAEASTAVYLVGDANALATLNNVGTPKDTAFDTTRPISLNYGITIDPAYVLPNVTIPFAATVGSASSPIPAGGWVATAKITASNGTVLFQPGQLIPAGYVISQTDILGAGTVLPITVQVGIVGTVGGTTYTGQYVPAGTNLQIFSGTGNAFYGGILAPDQIYLAQNVLLPNNALIPALTEALFGGTFGTSTTVTAVTEVAFRPTVEQFGGATPVQGYLFPLAQMLPAGDLSWDMSFVAGANLGAASAASVLPSTTLNGGAFTPPSTMTDAAPGSLLIDDQHNLVNTASASTSEPAYSVIRTGTGDLSLVAGGDVDQSSLYGIYTAGTQDPLGNGQDAQFNAPRAPLGSAGALLTGNTNVSQQIAALYQAYYPTGGGDLLLAAQGSVTSDVYASGSQTGAQAGLPPSDLVGDWLWRQGSTQLGQPTAWWINFGTLVVPLNNTGDTSSTGIALTGFTGFGALGGGNVTVTIGGNAGQTTDRDEGALTGGAASSGPQNTSGEGLVIAVGGTGRLLPGSTTPIITGGGNVNVTIGGVLNPLDEGDYAEGAVTGLSGASTENPAVNGDVINLRGNITITAGAIGRIDYQFDAGTNNLFDPRALNPFAVDNGVPNGGLEVVPGDGTVTITTDRDLVLQGAADPGRVTEQNLTDLAGYTQLGTVTDPAGFSGFSLWQDSTSIALFSAGGNVTPTTLPNLTTNIPVFNDAPTDYRSLYPATLLVTAATGSIIYGQDNAPPSAGHGYSTYSLETAPAPDGTVSFLAGTSIIANGYAVDLSGANPAGLSLPTDPAFVDLNQGATGLTNILTGIGTNPSPLALFALEPDTPTTNLHANDPNPARFYAATGDIVNFQTGETIYFDGNTTEADSEWYIAAKPVWIIAGNDIVSTGTRPGSDPDAAVFGTQENQQAEFFTPPMKASITYFSSGNLFLNNTPESISLIQANRDILSAYAYVGGPGTLQVSAGRNLYQAGYTASSPNGAAVQVLDFGSLKSLGDNLIAGSPLSSSAGAGIDVLAGVGAAGPDYTAFADLYFNPTNQANLALPITAAANAGKVQQVYASELVTWLTENYGYTGTASGALQAFLALPTVDQGVFVRQVFFAELAASGAQETNPNSRFFKSYTRGRQAIDTLFPSTGKQTTPGVPVGYTGAITMYSGTVEVNRALITTPTGGVATFDGGIATLFGGAVQVLDPGGATTFGITGGPAPGNSSGIVTFGAGDIDVYALGDVALGQSRIFTTGGGNLLIWSSSGDINAGIGAKTTVVYNPPELIYDDVGDITETPPANTSGAGIATLQPLPDVPAGDVTLIAPGGTIDPGEAGVRVSGNLTLAAAHVVTTNIAVGGKTATATVSSAPSLATSEAAGSTAGAAASAAESSGQRNNGPADTASVVDVEVVSIGGSYDEEQKRKKRGL
jgi:filamentous hemagglutinin family protein